MYRFRKENWVRKVDSSYPKHWSKSSREYGFFMEQPSHTAESQYMETHSDRVLRNPYIAPTIPRARMSVADKVPRKHLRKHRKRVGVHYDYDDGNDMWDVLRHRENPSTGVRRLPRSLSPVARRSTLPTMKIGSPDNEQPILVDNPWYPMMRTNTAIGRGFGRVSHSRHGYQVESGRFGGERQDDFSPGIDGRHGHATDYNRVKTPKVATRNSFHGNQMETGSFRGELNREPTGLNINGHSGYATDYNRVKTPKVPIRNSLHRNQVETGTFLGKLNREPTGVNISGHSAYANDYSRANTPGLSREYTLGPRLHTIGPREYHGLPEPGHLSNRRPDGHLEDPWRDTASRRGRSLSPRRDRDYSAGTSRYFDGRIGSPTPRRRKETLNERFFRFNFHEPWKASIRT